MSKYAIIETGSKQYCVEPESVIHVEKLKLADNPKNVTLENVLLVRDGDKLSVGNPNIKGAKVVCDFLGNIRGKKTISFKYRRRKGSRVTKGHRQAYSRLRVKEIKLGG